MFETGAAGRSMNRAHEETRLWENWEGEYSEWPEI
jgi:hypothetical protein